MGDEGVGFRDQHLGQHSAGTLLLQQRLMRLTEAEAGGQGRGKYQRMIRAMVNEAITD